MLGSIAVANALERKRPFGSITEQQYAPRAWARTKLPLMGLTLAGDGFWSGRFWERSGRSTYRRADCESTRVSGSRLAFHYHPGLRPAPVARASQLRTVSAWGEPLQADLARLRVGAGSVGALVAEALARTGVQQLRLIDFDTVKTHNLDRLLHARQLDARLARSKVETLQRGLLASATAGEPLIEARADSLVEERGFAAALDCDVLFSCVDRPWPRAALNLIAYAHQIPVIDGGIRVTVRDSRLRSADWKAHVVGPGRRCLECLGQFDPAFVAMDRQGDLDDPSYIHGLPAQHSLRASENVFAFSMAVGALEVLQLLRSLIAPGGRSDVGSQHHSFTRGQTTLEERDCEPTCWYSTRYLSRGDQAGLKVTGRHAAAEAERAARRVQARRLPMRVAHFLDGRQGWLERAASRLVRAGQSG